MECEYRREPCRCCAGCNGKDEFGCEYWRKHCDGSRDGCVPCDGCKPCDGCVPCDGCKPCDDHFHPRPDHRPPPPRPPVPPFCGGPLEHILRDPDLLLVAALMLALYRERCDMKLLLALGYILFF